MASQEIETLSAALARLPGLGPRSARRAVLWLIKRPETSLVQLLAAVLTPIKEELKLSDEQLGTIQSAFMWGYFLTSPIFGYLGDRLPLERVERVAVPLGVDRVELP